MHRKGHTKRTHTKKRRTMKGGFYGASGAIAPGAMAWSTGSEMGQTNTRGGNSMIGARRRKGKKTRKVTRRHKHRGGGHYGAVSASFQGSGSRGIANYTGVDTKGPGGGSAAHGAWNDKGAGPGDFRSFAPAK